MSLRPLVPVIAVLLLTACAESRDPTGAASDSAAVSEAMNSVYERFTRAYRLGEPDSVLVLYTEAPLYLPGQGRIVRGRDGVREQFGFLRAIAERGGTAHISFESVARGTSGDLAYDVGYYTLRQEGPDGSLSPPSRGKFTTVWKRDAEGRWRIHVDGFSPAPPPRE